MVTPQIASAADLRRNLAPFASQHCREIWLSMHAGGPSLSALMNTNVGWLMYLRHDDGETGFSSRNPMYSESELGGLAFDGRHGQEHIAVITCGLSNGQEDEFLAFGRYPSGTSCAPWNTLFSMRAVGHHFCEVAW